MYDYDLIVIGGGSGGLVAARLAAAFGAKVALIDKERLGGDCLHYGCVPSKTLIHIAKIAHDLRHAAARGVIAAPPTVAMPRVAATIAGVIDTIGVEEQIYVEQVDVRFGHAEFANAHTLLLNGMPLTAKSFIIATGSRPAVPELPGLPEAGYLTNENVFSLDHLPPSLIVLGGGPIGCELAQAFARLGSQVTLLQRPDRLLPREEPDVSQAILAALRADGVTVELPMKTLSVSAAGDQRIIACQHVDGTPFTVQAAAILVALGRRPNLEQLGLEKAGVRYTPKGITIDDKTLQTSVSNIFAIGDVAGGYQFTHFAAAQGGVAAPNALLPGFLARKMHAEVVPWVTFTDPEAARVGLTEAEARQQHGSAVRVTTLPWSRIDRAQAEGATSGFIKLVLGKGDKILGAHLVGSHAGEVLSEVTLAMRHDLGIAEIIGTIHAYPTLATGLQQVAFEAYLTGKEFSTARGVVKRFIPKREWGGQ